MTEKENQIIAHMRDMVVSGKDLTLDGKPEVAVLSARVGFRVSGSERDRLMAALDEPVPEPEKVIHADPVEWQVKSGVVNDKPGPGKPKHDFGRAAKEELKRNPRPPHPNSHRIGKSRR